LLWSNANAFDLCKAEATDGRFVVPFELVWIIAYGVLILCVVAARVVLAAEAQAIKQLNLDLKQRKSPTNEHRQQAPQGN
jgi:hypothetical protein